MIHSPTFSSTHSYIQSIAYLQTIGILLVVLGHSLHEYPVDNGESTWLFRAIYSFHMPLFVFISGVLMLYTSKRQRFARSFRSFVWAKVKHLLLPYVVLLSAVFLPRCWMSGFADEPISPNLSTFVANFIDKDALAIPFYWFIQCIFLLQLIHYPIIRYAQNQGDIALKIAVITMLLIESCFNATYWMYEETLFSLGFTLHYAVFFTTGMLYAFYYDKISKILISKHTSIVSWVLFTTIWTLLFHTLETDSWVFCFCSLSGILACLSLAQIIESHSWKGLDHLQGAYYMIFLLSWFCNTVCQQVLHHLVDMPWPVYTILSVVSSIYLPLLVYRFIQRHRHNKCVAVIAVMLGH
jgi:fucose 4-O-acetylase-like acetyltransferase